MSDQLIFKYQYFQAEIFALYTQRFLGSGKANISIWTSGIDKSENVASMLNSE